MFSTKEAMELAADWAVASGDLRNAIEAACDRVDALERENAAMANVVKAAKCLRRQFCASRIWTPEECDLDAALAALAPATAKETP